MLCVSVAAAGHFALLSTLPASRLPKQGTAVIRLQLAPVQRSLEPSKAAEAPPALEPISSNPDAEPAVPPKSVEPPVIPLSDTSPVAVPAPYDGESVIPYERLSVCPRLLKDVSLADSASNLFDLRGVSIRFVLYIDEAGRVFRPNPEGDTKASTAAQLETLQVALQGAQFSPAMQAGTRVKTALPVDVTLDPPAIRLSLPPACAR